MPRTPMEYERIRQAARKKILEAGMSLFINKGYHATSVNDIARQAGISKGLLYNYFKGKEELLATMVDERVHEIVEVMNQASFVEDPFDQLRQIISGAIENVSENPEVYRFYLHLQTQPEADHELIKYSHTLIKESARQFEFQCEIFEKMGIKEARKRSLYFSSTLQGVMFMIATYQHEFPVDEIKKHMIEEFCK